MHLSLNRCASRQNASSNGSERAPQASNLKLSHDASQWFCPSMDRLDRSIRSIDGRLGSIDRSWLGGSAQSSVKESKIERPPPTPSSAPPRQCGGIHQNSSKFECLQYDPALGPTWHPGHGPRSSEPAEVGRIDASEAAAPALEGAGRRTAPVRTRGCTRRLADRRRCAHARSSIMMRSIIGAGAQPKHDPEAPD